MMGTSKNNKAQKLGSQARKRLIIIDGGWRLSAFGRRPEQCKKMNAQGFLSADSR
jgi:hypothetical protein